MSRLSRVYGNTGIYHIIIRGNNKQEIFYNDEDRNFLLNRIQKFSEELEISIYAYCLMSNHVHLLIGNGNRNMSKFMLKLNTSYARTFNRKYERTGHLFQGRYLSKPIETDESFKTILRYILQNPEKAGLGKYNEYIWNSFFETAFYSFDYHENQNKKTKKYKIKIDVNTVYSFFNTKQAFFSFIKLSNTDKCMEYENKKVYSDEHCLRIIYEILHIKNIRELQNYQSDLLKEKIRLLKEFGIPSFQISRVTGISKYFIYRS